MVERLKKCAYQDIYGTFYFWRTYDGQEIDLVEEREGKLFGYEFKWSDKKKEKVPKDGLISYDNAEYEVISRSNYLDFILYGFLQNDVFHKNLALLEDINEGVRKTKSGY